MDDVALTPIATGTAPVISGPLGRIDPTLLENGLYRVRLTAEDANGLTTVDERIYRVDGMAKVGNYRLSFVDLRVPLVGVPITVVRTYDSRVKSREDFGVGWTLEIKRGTYENNRTPGQGWQILPGALGFPCQNVRETLDHVTEVRLSDYESYTFALTVNRPTGLAGGCDATAGFRFVDGRRPGATLEILDGTQILFVNGGNDVVDPETFLPYEPRRVRLTTPDGRIVDFEKGAGIVRIADMSDNAVTIGDGGIVHSSGTSIRFQRDALGRITEITDPRGQVLRYAYDAAGDLVSFRDQADNQTTFAYDTRHNLTELRDPLGNRAVRSEFDADGRLIAVIDPNGNRLSFEHDLAARTEISTDRNGTVSAVEYDARGNVTRRTDALGGTETFVLRLPR